MGQLRLRKYRWHSDALTGREGSHVDTAYSATITWMQFQRVPLPEIVTGAAVTTEGHSRPEINTGTSTLASSGAATSAVHDIHNSHSSV